MTSVATIAVSSNTFQSIPQQYLTTNKCYTSFYSIYQQALPMVSCSISGITCCSVTAVVCSAGLTLLSISHNCSSHGDNSLMVFTLTFKLSSNMKSKPSSSKKPSRLSSLSLTVRKHVDMMFHMAGCCGCCNSNAITIVAYQ